MVRLLLPAAAALAACTAAPQNDAMTSPTSPSQAPASSAQEKSQRAGAAVAPSQEPVSAAANPLPARQVDAAAAAEGRRALSTAFVRVGPDGLLTVEKRGGQVLTLRAVVMGPDSYCGIPAGTAKGKYCGSYAEVAAARPGGAPPPAQPDLAAPNPAPTGERR
ncbi:hypothetical protein OMW55_02550 [Sphingomonas sp. BN140010]|uniref:Lipoprotein n=1 Tax=Sphingomonas arvum TaxID=2992113 RepID=A0ABT3JC80_9SPHN|nr:hypothetical protein [Sphingomonas sp. BN140010]MCW3796687.1 hypothetical protein [Sphingomonas sp. BN140010]